MRRASILGKTFVTETFDHREVDQHPELEQEVVLKERRESLLASTGTQGLSAALGALIKSGISIAMRRQSLMSQLSLCSVKKTEDDFVSTRTPLEMIQYRKMKKAIAYDTPSDYYDHLPLKPGVEFFKSLVPEHGCEQLRVDFRVPKTAIVYEKVYFTEWLEHENVTLITDRFMIHEFYQDFKEKASSPSDLVAVRRTDARCAVLSLNDLFEQIYKSPLPNVGLYQERIKPKHEDRPALLRVFIVNSTRSGKVSHAFVIANTHESPSLNSICRYIIRTDLPCSFTVYRQSCLSLQKAMLAGDQIISHLQRRYYIRIEEIVLDFIEDLQGQLWLISCKGYRVEDVEIPRYIPTRIEQVRCRLCLHTVKTREMEHVLPFKMLLLFKYHAARRGRLVINLSHIRANSQDYLSHWIRLCDLCHMIVQAEFMLLQTENELGRLLNIPVSPPEILGNPLYNYPNYMPAQLPQWRLFLCFDHIEWISTNKTPGLFLKFRVFEATFSLYRSLKLDKIDTLNAAKLFYYYSDTDQNTLQNVQQMMVTVKIGKGKGWEGEQFSASFRPLTVFSKLPSGNSACAGSMRVPVYRKEEDVTAWIRVVVGIECGHETVIKELQTSIKRMGDLFLPDPGFMTCDALSEEWLEAVDCHYRVNLEKTIIRDEDEELETCYSPLLSLRRMLSMPAIRIKPTSEVKRRSPKIRLSHPFLSKKSRRTSSVSTPISTTTASSAHLFYTVDQRTHLKSPTFLPSRMFMTATTTPQDWTIERASNGDESSSDIERVEKMISVPEGQGDQVKGPLVMDTIDACLRSRHLSPVEVGSKGKKSEWKRPHTAGTGRRRDALSRVYSPAPF